MSLTKYSSDLFILLSLQLGFNFLNELKEVWLLYNKEEITDEEVSDVFRSYLNGTSLLESVKKVTYGKN